MQKLTKEMEKLGRLVRQNQQKPQQKKKKASVPKRKFRGARKRVARGGGHPSMHPGKLVSAHGKPNTIKFSLRLHSTITAGQDTSDTGKFCKICLLRPEQAYSDVEYTVATNFWLTDLAPSGFADFAQYTPLKSLVRAYRVVSGSVQLHPTSAPLYRAGSVGIAYIPDIDVSSNWNAGTSATTLSFPSVPKNLDELKRVPVLWYGSASEAEGKVVSYRPTGPRALDFIDMEAGGHFYVDKDDANSVKTMMFGPGAFMVAGSGCVSGSESSFDLEIIIHCEGLMHPVGYGALGISLAEMPFTAHGAAQYFGNIMNEGKGLARSYGKLLASGGEFAGSLFGAR